ncbi:MAG TPA: hypothetical protein VI197_05080 [Polyangiaceae bacterium]
MGFPALVTPTAAEAVLVLDLDGLFRRLPTVARAKVTWTRPRIDAGLGRLLNDPLDDALLDEVAQELLEPVLALSQAAIQLLSSNRDEFRTFLMADLNQHEARLDSFLPDDDSRDTIAWMFGFLRSLLGTLLTIVVPNELSVIDQEQFAQATDSRELRSFMRAQVALTAAVQAAKDGVKPVRCAELIDIAFLDLMEFKKAIRSHGLWVSPFPTETSDEHRERLKRYADRLRETLTAEDWKTLDGARMGDLR